MNLDRLEIFLRIVETGSMGAASRQIHLTQPALSHALKQLEQDLGAPLFDRRGRGLVLTAAGRALAPRAKALLEASRSLARDIGRHAAQGYFDYRIGTVDSVATFLLPRVVEPLHAAFPALALKLYTARSADLLHRVDVGELDAVIVAASGPPKVTHWQRVRPYRLQFYGRKDRFARLGRARTDAEVATFPIVEIESLLGQPSMIAKDAPSFAIANSLASVKALVLAGFGIGALLDFMLTAAEKRLLARARVPHDPDCNLFLVSAPSRTAPSDQRLDLTLLEALRRALP